LAAEYERELADERAASMRAEERRRLLVQERVRKELEAREKEEDARRRKAEKARKKQAKLEQREQKLKQEAAEATRERDRRRKSAAAMARKGSDAMRDKDFQSAQQVYADLLYRFPAELSSLTDAEQQVLRYTYAVACGKQKDIKGAQKEFLALVADAERFAPAYYGLASIHCAKHNYKAALETLALCQKHLLLWQSGVNYPFSEDEIRETRPKRLEKLADALKRKCENPPPPDAMCAYVSCNAAKREMYVGEDGYKGHTSLVCGGPEACRTDYHTSCWRALKKSDPRMDENLLTVDHGGCPSCDSDVQTVLLYVPERGRPFTCAAIPICERS